MNTVPARQIVNPAGQPVRSQDFQVCPTCGAKADKRIETCGFGAVRPVICGVCAYEFLVEAT